MKKWLILVAGAGLIVAFLIWLFMESSKPLLGAKVEDEGREHVAIGTQVEYKTNPPTSGKHYADWIRAGVYDQPKDDGYLVHSLEHGYVIMSYNCDKKVTLKRHPDENQDPYRFRSAGRSIKSGTTFVSDVYAHGIEEASPSAEESSPSASLPENFRSDNCHKLVDQLISVYEKKGKKKLIIIPRPNMDSRIALTAWNYIDKFDPSTHSTGSTGSPQAGSGQASSGLSVNEMERVEKFIDTYRDQGPEKTVE